MIKRCTRKTESGVIWLLAFLPRAKARGFPARGSYFMNLSLDDPYSDTPSSYNTQDDLLEAMDAYIKECEAQNDLCGLTQYENALDAKE